MAKVKYVPIGDMPITTTNLGYEFDARKATEVDDDEKLAVFKGHPHFEVEGKKKEKPADPETDTGIPTLHAKETARGKFSIFHGDDEIKSGLSKYDADEFNAMTAEDKAEYVK